MQVVVKTPRIRVEGEISGSLLRYLRSQYGEVEVIENSDDELIEVKHSDWYRSIRGTITPGENLRIYREMHGFTQDQLAERIGNISRRNISDMERGHKVIIESVAENLRRSRSYQPAPARPQASAAHYRGRGGAHPASGVRPVIQIPGITAPPIRPLSSPASIVRQSCRRPTVHNRSGPRRRAHP